MGIDGFDSTDPEDDVFFNSAVPQDVQDEVLRLLELHQMRSTLAQMEMVNVLDSLGEVEGRVLIAILEAIIDAGANGGALASYYRGFLSAMRYKSYGVDPVSGALPPTA